MKKCEKGIPPLKRTKPSKKAQERHDLIFKKIINLIGGGMIGNSNYIGTCLTGLTLNQHPKELNSFRFLQKSSILIIMIEQLILLVILNWKNWILMIFIKETRQIQIIWLLHQTPPAMALHKSTLQIHKKYQHRTSFYCTYTNQWITPYTELLCEGVSVILYPQNHRDSQIHSDIKENTSLCICYRYESRRLR